MSFESNRKALNDYVAANWPTTWLLVGENVPPPSDRSKAWVRYSLRPAVTQAWDVQSSVERTSGFMWFQAFLPENSGSTEAYKISDAVRAILYEKRILDAKGVTILTRAPEMAYVGVDPDGSSHWRCL